MCLLVELFDSPYSSLELIERVPINPKIESYEHEKKKEDGQLELPLDQL